MAIWIYIFISNICLPHVHKTLNACNYIFLYIQFFPLGDKALFVLENNKNDFVKAVQT